MIISATFLKPRERRIRDEARAEGIEEGMERGIEEGMERGVEQGIERGVERGIEIGRVQAAQTLELERAAWQAWYQRSELARAKGEEPPPPPFFGSDNGQSS